MSLKLEEIKSLIKKAIPDAEIVIQDLAGDENHYSATIKSKFFVGKNKIEQHMLIIINNFMIPYPFSSDEVSYNQIISESVFVFL